MYETLPNNEDAEKAVLGSVILNNFLIAQAVAQLEPGDFYSGTNQQIFAAMVELDRGGVEINPITLRAQIGSERQQVEVSYITDLAYGLPHSTNITHYVAILKEKSARRRIAQLGESIRIRASDNIDVQDLLREADQSLIEIRQRTGLVEKSFRPITKIAEDATREYKRLRRGDSGAIPTGYGTLDKVTRGGVQPGDVWVIASLTGGGKSSWALGAARAQAERSIPVALVSREMSDLENFMRLHSAVSRVPVWKIRPGMNPGICERLEEWHQFLASLPIWINSTTGNIFEIRAQVRDLVRTLGVRSLIVDYLQLVGVTLETKNATRAQEVATVSRVLKEIAMENQIGVFALAQFNRQAANGERPELHHLAESSGIERDASLVLILDMDCPKDRESERACTMRIAKHRNGPLLELAYKYTPDTFTFEDVECLDHNE